MMAPRRRLTAASGVALALWVIVAAPAHADSANGVTTDEAWYATLPTCALPTGCGPTGALPPASAYPSGTMHVGIAAGAETARSYLAIDRSAIPNRSIVQSALLVVPVADAEDGTVNAEHAAAVVCLATEPFTDAEGSTATPPGIDCASAAPLELSQDDPLQWRADITPLVASAEGAAVRLALLPAPAAAPTDTWHVAFAEHAASATWTFVPPSSEVSGAPTTAGGVTPASPPSPRAPSFEHPSTRPAPSAGPAAPPAETDPRPIAPASATPLLPAGGGPGFAYPAVFAVPLLLLALVGYLGTTFTRPIVLRSER